MLGKYYEEIEVGQEDMYYLIRTYVRKVQFWTPWVEMDAKVPVPETFCLRRYDNLVGRGPELIKSRGRFVIKRNWLFGRKAVMMRQSLYESEAVVGSDSVCLGVKDGSAEFLGERLIDEARCELDDIRDARKHNAEVIKDVENGEL